MGLTQSAQDNTNTKMNELLLWWFIEGILCRALVLGVFSYNSVNGAKNTGQDYLLVYYSYSNFLPS